MGMEKTVRPVGAALTWEALRDFLGQRGYPLTLRMIDGELAFPDEVPPATWRELRVGTPQGMVTLRRAGDAVTLVTWGNADAALRQAWNALVWACAAVGGGQIETEQGAVSAEEFRGRAELPESLTS
jgi:hypothetical protein